MKRRSFVRSDGGHDLGTESIPRVVLIERPVVEP